MFRMTGFLVLGMLSAFLLGCSDQVDTNELGATYPNAAALAGQLPPLPVERQPSMLMGFVQLGFEAGMRHATALDEGSSLRLASAPGAVCWGVWGFSTQGSPISCSVDYSAEAGAGAYFAITDYQRGTWEVAGPVPGPQQILTIDEPRFFNGSGDVYIAVIAFDGASILVDQLVLTEDIAPVMQDIENSGGHTSLASVNGMPAISFYDASGGDLRYVHATSIFGASWDTPLTLDSTGDTGKYTSLKVVDGYPAIAYYDDTEDALRYIRAANEAGTLWGLPVTVDNSSAAGEFCSLEVVAGKPAISYYDFDGGQLRYVRSLDSMGATWDMPLSPDSDGNTGQYSSLEVVDGNPAISYRNGGSSQLRYVRASDAEGTTWNAPQLLDADGSAGFYSSMAIVNGRPAIAYYAGGMGDLRYIRALDSTGSAWDSPQTLDGAEDEGSFCSLAVIGSGPAISCHGGLQGDLRYYQAFDSNGDSWASAVILDESSVITGRDTALIDVYGAPAISYFDQTNGRLRYAWGL